MNQDWILSIDFGTSNTAAAHTNHSRGNVEAVSLSQNHLTMPSSVYIETPEHIETGGIALDKAARNPAGFLAAPKRVVPRQTIQINGFDVPLSMPVAAILESVVRKASREHNLQRPSELVLTHPEAWSDAEVKVLLDAAEKLGLNATAIRTVSEPKAAAQYYSQVQPLKPGDRIAVFDFGGGTLDIAVLQAAQDGSFTILNADGDNALGGKSFDSLINKWVLEQLEEENPEHAEYLRRSAPPSKLRALEDSIRWAKELLSETSTATVKIPSAPGQEEDTPLQLTRGEFEEIIRPTLERAVALTESTLRRAGVNKPEDLQALYLTGGSARIPLVHEMLGRLGPIATLDDPKLVVAQGAISAAAPLVRGLQPTSAGATGSASDSETAEFPVQTPASGNRTEGMPVAGSAPTTGTPKNKSSSRWGKIGAAAAVAVALIGGITWAATGTRDTPEPEAAAPTAQTNEAAATTAAPTTSAARLSTADDIYNALPMALQDATSGCFASNNGTRITCDMELTEATAEFFASTSPYDTPKVSFAVGAEDARRERAMITAGSYNNGQDVEPLESADGNALAVATDSTGQTADLHYANKETGLIISSMDFASADAAADWLTHYDLL